MNAWKHFCTINAHRWRVLQGCFRIGLYRQGLTHDLSKYSPTEFWTGARYYQGTRSPNAAGDSGGMKDYFSQGKGLFLSTSSRR